MATPASSSAFEQSHIYSLSFFKRSHRNITLFSTLLDSSVSADSSSHLVLLARTQPATAGGQGPTNKVERRIGLILFVIGGGLCATGTFILYTSLNEYTQCLVSASTACSYLSGNQLSVRFLDRQQAGNTLDLFGLLSFILASTFYAIGGQNGTESPSLETESEPNEKKEKQNPD